jgi:hypothetical protein
MGEQQMTLQEAAKLSMACQDACNLTGVLYSWARVGPVLWAEANRLGKGTDWVNSHPVNILFASKLASLTHCESASTFSTAWDAACKLAEGVAA